MTSNQRKSVENGIWLCEIHGKVVDANDPRYTVELLREWKTQAELESWRRVIQGDLAANATVDLQIQHDASARMREAATTYIEDFRRSPQWPSTNIPLHLQVDGLDEPVTTSNLATAVESLDNLILVAPPGMGKTSSVFQIAEAILTSGSSVPIIVSLGDWSTEGTALLDSILQRQAFRAITEEVFRDTASEAGVVLLLDGWNELDSAARERAAVQIDTLQRELEGLRLLVSTRRQALDVPVTGTRVQILPLNERQQFDIANSLRGDTGAALLDAAWRTPGVRELVTIPLYLTVLLALPDGTPFPNTKEEVLRRFVAAHEEDHRHAAALAGSTFRLHDRFLEGLAAATTTTANTTIEDSSARRSVAETDNALLAEGQLVERLDPTTVLDALVAHHVLTRSGDPVGYSFHHQQFQEWFASLFVERLMLSASSDYDARSQLASDVLNMPAWEEAILFACERLARGTPQQQHACSVAILHALKVDPILSAEMIYRSTDEVWEQIESEVRDYVERWHTEGTIDRAVRFMVSSGRPEFLDQVWPLISDDNSQVHLLALRAGSRFRTSILGDNAAERLSSLPTETRKHVLGEIVHNSGMDGLDLAAAVAQSDPDPQVKASVVGDLAFRLADRHITDLLRDADDETFDLVARRGLVDEVTDEAIQTRLAAAHTRLLEDDDRPYNQVYTLVHGDRREDPCAELVTAIEGMEIDDQREGAVNLIYEAEKNYPRSVADGLLRRVYAGTTLPYRSFELVLGSDYVIEDDDLFQIAMEGEHMDNRADAAAAALGPRSVGKLIDELMVSSSASRDAEGRFNRAAADRTHFLQRRIEHTPTSSLIAAISERSADASVDEIEEFADLISRHPNGGNDNPRPFEGAALETVAGFVEDWSNKLLTSSDSTRRQLASVATLASRAPSPRLLPLLKQLLDEELARLAVFREQAQADGFRGGPATDEARTGWTLQYRRAFHAFKGPETAELMCEYLLHDEFGEDAALVLAAQWRDMNEPADSSRWRQWPDYSLVSEKRELRSQTPQASSTEADAIFAVVEQLLDGDPTDNEKRNAVKLAIVAAPLPHGQRPGIIASLISIAGWRARSALLHNLVLSGEIIGTEHVRQGIADVFDEAETRAWVLTEGHALRDWLRILPFTDRPTETFDIVTALPEQHRTLDAPECLFDALGFAPGVEAEDVLFEFAAAAPDQYLDRVWLDAVFRRGTETSAIRLVELIREGILNERRGIDRWHLAKRISELFDEHASLRQTIYEMLRDNPSSPGVETILGAVAENPDAEGLLLLVELEMQIGRSLVPRRTVEHVVTEHLPIEGWQGAYNIVAVPATELRRSLLAMTSDGGSADAAARCLRHIDQSRDEHGTPLSEPRHPDLASGKVWPILPN